MKDADGGGRGRGGLVERVLWMGCVVCDGAIATGWEGWGSEGAGGPAGGKGVRRRRMGGVS